MNIGRNHCAYIGCNHIRRFSERSFFKFPVKDPDRCKEWLKNSGNVQLIDNFAIMGSNVVCEEHFPPKYVICHNGKKTLTRTGVPQKYDELQQQCEFIYYYIIEILVCIPRMWKFISFVKSYLDLCRRICKLKNGIKEADIRYLIRPSGNFVEILTFINYPDIILFKKYFVGNPDRLCLEENLQL